MVLINFFHLIKYFYSVRPTLLDFKMVQKKDIANGTAFPMKKLSLCWLIIYSLYDQPNFSYYPYPTLPYK